MRFSKASVVGLFALAVCIGLTSLAAADWVAYNDLMDPYSGGAGTTNYIREDQSGVLLDYAGNSTGVTLTISDNGVTFPDYPGQGYSFGTAGTDGYIAFEGVDGLSAQGLNSYPSTANWWNDYTFTGLNPNKLYRIVMSATRASSSNYPERWTGHEIIGADSSVYASSTPGADPYIVKLSETKVTIGYGRMAQRWGSGYVASWTDINPGADGSFKFRTWPDTSQPVNDSRKAYIPSVILLEEIPEPSSIILLVIGVLVGLGVAVLRRRK